MYHDLFYCANHRLVEAMLAVSACSENNLCWRSAMTLTQEQIKAIQHGDPVRIKPAEVGAECVLLRADVYERVRAVLEDGLSMEQVAALVEQNMREDDEQDPLLDSYQKYRR
jgi:hypothetical protein